MRKVLSLVTSTAYFRGHYLPLSDANVSIASSPFLYGLAIYTVFSVNWNSEHNQLYAFRLREHYERLVNSARIMDFEDFRARYTYDAFKAIMLELLRKNDVREDALVRVMVFVDELSSGTTIRGHKNELAVYVYPLGELLPRSGAKLGVSSWQRTSDNMIPARAKVCGSYINASLMKNEATLNGFDDAIALDAHGHVTESTVANIFLIRDNILITPNTSTDMLEGITRNTVFQIAKELDIPVVERSIDRSELYGATEALLVGSSAHVTPIIAIDHRPVGDGAIGPITRRISEHYSALQHGLLAHNQLTPVFSTAPVTLGVAS